VRWSVAVGGAIFFGLWERDKYPVLLVRGDAFVEEHVVEDLCEFGLDCLPIGVVEFKACPINTRCFMTCSGAQRAKYLLSRNRLLQMLGVRGWRLLFRTSRSTRWRIDIYQSDSTKHRRDSPPEW
jgi:hypothetical protein